jgi:hypothetical protein
VNESRRNVRIAAAEWLLGEPIRTQIQPAASINQIASLSTSRVKTEDYIHLSLDAAENVLKLIEQAPNWKVFILIILLVFCCMM